ncbi:trans-aconitate methyltransferase 1 [Coemansia sp. RSA 1813]|nr:trans-aconitate methyltransferase 1 [Coemansia sp. RSA 1646]KAJ1773765.1 trans-aconitate methyltransferase 1 [Coemansia sp. RSA 1843]KAJ2093727.1 trans-aconitate methyltransferase 1 [Coemansia sp. RSA 986]KAJ2217939.1 trans-aconitate methyltransferase 1 [Coemansia sp. RSA 487]KAJ2573219.1 trans-aconitate methyltransferase 1 [Coemansia sp. RSA 1813]
MASKGTPIYDPENYQDNRPTYKPSLVSAIVAFHKKSNPNAQTDLAVDVATGTGIFARELPRYFTKVVGTDISADMLSKARAKSKSSIKYVQSSAEMLRFLGDKTVDLITVATGAHWFDIPRFVAEAKRVLKPTGTLAIFGYTGMARFIKYPQCDMILRDYATGKDMLGPYWEAGRDVLVEGYVDYHKELAKNGWSSIQRSSYPCVLESAPSQFYPVHVPLEPNVVDFKVNWRKLRHFLSTWSPLEDYDRDHPEVGNLCDTTIDDMMLAAGVENPDEDLKVDWEQTLLMCHPPKRS